MVFSTLLHILLNFSNTAANPMIVVARLHYFKQKSFLENKKT